MNQSTIQNNQNSLSKLYTSRRIKTQGEIFTPQQRKFNYQNANRKKSLILPEIQLKSLIKKRSQSNCPTSQQTQKNSIKSLTPIQSDKKQLKIKRESFKLPVLNIENIKQIKYNLKGQNRSLKLTELLFQNLLFRKFGKFLTNLLLNVGRIIFSEKNDILYNQGTIIKYIYVLLVGKMLIKNQQIMFRKYVVAGQSLCEQVLFLVNSQYQNRINNLIEVNHQQTCKCVQNAALLRIPHHKYYQISVSLIKNGYKSQFNCLDNNLRRNFVNKKNLKSQKRQDYGKGIDFQSYMSKK